MTWSAVAVITAIVAAIATGALFGIRISMALGAILQELKEMRGDQAELKAGQATTVNKLSSVESRVSRIEGRINGGSKYAVDPY